MLYSEFISRECRSSRECPSRMRAGVQKTNSFPDLAISSFGTNHLMLWNISILKTVVLLLPKKYKWRKRVKNQWYKLYDLMWLKLEKWQFSAIFETMENVYNEGVCNKGCGDKVSVESPTHVELQGCWGRAQKWVFLSKGNEQINLTIPRRPSE